MNSMSLGTGVRAMAGALAVGLVTACATIEVMPTPAPAPPPQPEPGVYQVAGTLTDEGVECPAMRDDAGRLFTFVGDLEGFQAGDRVRVTGRIAEAAICMQGTTMEIIRIERR